MQYLQGISNRWIQVSILASLSHFFASTKRQTFLFKHLILWIFLTDFAV